MLSFKEYFSKVQSKFPFEFTQNSVLIAVIASIVLLSSYALFRPISTAQYHQIQGLMNQHSYPQSQAMALKLSMQQDVSNAEFFRLMYAVDFESSKIKQYPALNIEDIQ